MLRRLAIRRHKPLDDDPHQRADEDVTLVPPGFADKSIAVYPPIEGGFGKGKTVHGGGHNR